VLRRAILTLVIVAAAAGLVGFVLLTIATGNEWLLVVTLAPSLAMIGIALVIGWSRRWIWIGSGVLLGGVVLGGVLLFTILPRLLPPEAAAPPRLAPPPPAVLPPIITSPLSPLDIALQKLFLGNIAFNTPDLMRLGKSKIISQTIGKSARRRVG
jgi:hypothetical protein